MTFEELMYNFDNFGLKLSESDRDWIVGLLKKGEKEGSFPRELLEEILIRL